MDGLVRFAANDLAGLQKYGRGRFFLFTLQNLFATDDYLILGKVVKRLAGDQFFTLDLVVSVGYYHSRNFTILQKLSLILRVSYIV